MSLTIKNANIRYSKMTIKKIVQLLLVSLFAFGVAGCTIINEAKYGAQINELNTLFNTQRVYFGMSSQMNNEHSDTTTFYADEEKIIQGVVSYKGFKEIYLKDAYLLEGDKFKVLIGLNNEHLFSDGPGNIDMRNYITKIDSQSTSDILMTTINYKKMASAAKIDLNNSELSELYSILKVDLANLPFYVFYKNGIITKFSIVLDKYAHDIQSSIKTYRINYSVYGYEQNLKTANINIEEYTKVDVDTLLEVQKDIEMYYRSGGKQHLVLEQTTPNGFINEPKQDEVVAKLKYNTISGTVVREVKYKETTYNNDTLEHEYRFAGKTFSVGLRMIKALIEVDRISLALNYKLDNPIAYDSERDRILFKSGNVLKIFNTSNISIENTISVEGDIVNVFNHGSVYHVIATTSHPEDFPQKYSYNDEEFESKIYVIDPISFETLEIITIQSFSYATIIDKRNNVIISSGLGSHNPLYLYDSTDKTITKITEKSLDYEYGRCKLIYNSDEDFFIAYHQDLSGGPTFYYFENGKYIRGPKPPECRNISFGDVYFCVNNFLLNSSALFDISDWSNPIEYDVMKNIHASYVIRFRDKDNLYVAGCARSDDRYFIINKIEIKSGQNPRITSINVKGKIQGFTFGCVKDGRYYLYNNENEAIVVFNPSQQ